MGGSHTHDPHTRGEKRAAMDALELPFRFLRVPNLRLKVPSVSLPGPMTVFAFVFLSCFLVFSGIIYDIIVEPPSIGSQQEANGAVRPVVFLQYRINGQFIIEGLSAGFLFILGGFGVILLDKANAKALETKNRYFLLICGGVCVLVAYNLAIVFLRMKLPSYQHS
jgi:hypothetical protein